MQSDQYPSGALLLSQSVGNSGLGDTPGLFSSGYHPFFFSDRCLYEKQRRLSLSGQHAGFQCPGIAGDGGQIPESQDQMQGTCKRDPQRRTKLSGAYRNLELSGGQSDPGSRLLGFFHTGSGRKRLWTGGSFRA